MTYNEVMVALTSMWCTYMEGYENIAEKQGYSSVPAKLALEKVKTVQSVIDNLNYVNDEMTSCPTG